MTAPNHQGEILHQGYVIRAISPRKPSKLRGVNVYNPAARRVVIKLKGYPRRWQAEAAGKLHVETLLRDLANPARNKRAGWM